jgi:uncharacterized protein
MDKSNYNQNLYCKIICLVSSICIALGLIISGYYIGNGYAAARKIKYVTVKGLSEREVQADTSILSLSFSATSEDLMVAQTKIEKDTKKIIDFLISNGFTNDEIEIGQTTVIDKAAQQYTDAAVTTNRFIISSTVTLYSKKVELTKETSYKTGELIRNGVILGNANYNYQGPKFILTNIHSIKKDMLAEATQNAKVAAQEFAKNSESTVGNIKEASQGILVIHDKNSEFNVDQDINKVVRIVSTITYFLED